MLENRIKISSIVENQLPEFVIEEYPLVYEFLRQYYLSLESQGNPLDLIQNIDQYIKIDNLTNLKEFTFLSSDVSFSDDVISVESTEGFPNSYGLILIDDEIITYETKTNTSFDGCIRGFSGIESLTGNDSDKLVFGETEVSEHKKNRNNNLQDKTQVFNLSVLFLKQFFIKIKKQITPGLENKDFYEFLNEKLFINRSNDFYSSKGTEDSFKILFGALYGSNPKIILPRDYLIQLSDAQFRVTQDLVVEPISGNIFNLLNTTLYQDKDSSNIFSDARGTISDIKTIFRNGKLYYVVSLDSGYDKDIDSFGSIKSNFKIHPKTLLTNDIAENSTYIDVDSTIGFPNSGELIVDLDLDSDGINETTFQIIYKSKTLNQFLECSGIILPLSIGTEVKISNFAYGYDYISDEIVKVRITGVISGIESPTPNFYYEKGDLINIKTLGEDCEGIKENNWFFNIATNYEVRNIEDLQILENIDVLSNDLKITLIDNHNFVKGDRLSIFFSNNEEYGGLVNEINSSKEIIVKSDNNIPKSNLNLKSKVRKNISKLNVSLESVKNSDLDDVETYKTYSTNVKNTYVDYENTLYVSSSSLPKYLDREIEIDDFSYQFPDQLLSSSNNTNITIPNHGYYTGTSVIFRPSEFSSVEVDGIELTTSVYFVKVEDNDTIKLSRSRENIFTEKFVTVSGQLNGCRLELLDFNDIGFNSFKLKPQNLIKKISTPELNDQKIETDPGSVGIFANGVELLNYKSFDKVFYGPIEEVVVTSEGDDYDVINPPTLQINDQNGSDCVGHCSVIGKLKRFDIIDPGFDYLEEPSITISGGNGSGAKARPRMISFIHFAEFNSEQVDIVNNIIQFSDPHKLRDGEKVIYENRGQKSILGVKENSEYYVSIVDSLRIRIHNNLSDSISKINSVIFNESGLGIHRFKCLTTKKRISSIEILSSGDNYQNKKTKVTRINVATNELTIINHKYLSGEIITYYPQSMPIVGLTSSKSYYATKVDDDIIKLSEIGPDNDPKLFFNARKYINFTSESSSNHYFNYQPITVSVSGKIGISSTSGQDYSAKIVPIFRGKIQSVFVETGGVGYGSSDIINFDRQPNFNLDKPVESQLTAIVVDGSIEKVIVQSPGRNYISTPDIIIRGNGFGAILSPVIIDGSIAEVKVVSGGFGYDQNSTIIITQTPGRGVTFKSIIKSWRFNLVEKYILSGRINLNDGFISNGLIDLQYFHLYAPRSLRSSVYSRVLDNSTQRYSTDLQLNEFNVEVNSDKHSPIIGWAYDGNPIYGPYGYSRINSGPIKLMKSGYSLKYNLQQGRIGGPDIALYPLGSFIEDYEFKGDGDLDECNGRYCATPEFPNGVYAYFSTFTENSQNSGQFLNYKRPVFPYIVGNYYKSTPISFNFNQSPIIDEEFIVKNKLLRNTTPYNLTEDNSGYEFIFEPNKQKLQEIEVEFTNRGKVDFIDIINPGNNYKVNDSVILNDESIIGKVSKINGKGVISIASSTTSVDNIEFYPYGNYGNFIGISTIPHNFYNNSLVTLTSKYEYKKTNAIEVLNNTLVLVENVDSLDVTGVVTYFKVYGDLNFPVKENDFYKIKDEVIKILNIDQKNSTIRILRGTDSTIGFSTFYNAGTELKSLSRKLIFNTGITSDFYNYNLNDEYYFDPKLSIGIGLTSGVGITSTLFLSTILLNTPVVIEKGLETTIYFKNQPDINYYSSGGYVDIINSNIIEFNTTKKRIVSVGNTSIKIDFDTSSFPGGLTTSVNLNKWNILNIPTKSIYLPNHKISTNDSLIYNSNTGTPISISTDTLTSYELPNNSLVYAVKISNDLIGISTKPVSIDSNGDISGIGTNNDIVYFSGIGTSNYHSFKTNYQNILKGSLSKNISTVSTSSTHGLSLGDFVDIDIESETSTNIKLIYNDENRRFVVNPKIIENVNLIDKTLRISNHEFSNGEKVIYNSTNLIEGLVNNQIYYVVIIDSNTISLTNSLVDSRDRSPNIIEFISNGSGTLSSINPELKITKYQDIIFDVSDSSLSHISGQIVSSFDFKLFYDEKFINEFGTFNITKYGNIGIGTDSKITLKTKNLPDSLYYTLIPTNSDNIPISKKEIYIDKEQINHNKISLKASEISGRKEVIDFTSNTFSFYNINPSENNLYNLSNSKLKYETESKSSFGGISNIVLKNQERVYNEVPKIKNINTNNGNSAILKISSSDIGSILLNNIIIKDIGFNYSADNTIRPKCKLPTIIKVSPLNIFDTIEVLFKGINYISSPDLIVLDGLTNEIVNDVLLNYDITSKKVSILQNTQGITEIEPLIIPTNNDNGFLIRDIFYDSITNDVTIVLEGEFDDEINFPFSIGDEILIENVNVKSESEENLETEIVKGYNSENYNYKFFRIKTINLNLGGSGSNFSYSLEGLLNSNEIPGIYDIRFNKGSVIPKKYLARFTSKLKNVDFALNETVVSSGNFGVIQSWDPENNYLKVLVEKDFNIGDILIGQTSNIKSIIEDIISFNSYLQIDSNSVVKQGWKLNTGFLNDNYQRLYDSDYYQYFSYSIESEIDINKWNDVVSNLNHTSGFKKFGDILVEQFSDSSRVEESQNLGNYYSESIISDFINLNCVYDFDLVTENSFLTNNKLKSNEIYFDSRIIRDYIESIGNRVLIIDDISDKFTIREPKPFQVIDEFELENIRYKKYFIHIYDILDPTRNESLFVSLLNDETNGFLNQYAIISSEDYMGYFDFQVEDNLFGQFIFYPTIPERKIYKYSTFSTSIGNSLVGIANTSLNIGNIAKIEYVNTIIPSDGVESISLPGISTNQRAYKVLMLIADEKNSYCQFDEISILHDGENIVTNSYGDLNNLNIISNNSSGIVTFSSSFENGDLSIKLFSNVGIGTSLYVNATITSIDANGIDGSSLNILDNILITNFISTSMTGNSPENKLIFTHSNRYNATYSNILIEDKTNNEFEFIEMNTLLNNSIQETYVVEYGVLNFNNSIGKFTSQINETNGNFELYFTPYEDINYEIKILTTILNNTSQEGVITV
jgi:hypothetical protein